MTTRRRWWCTQDTFDQVLARDPWATWWPPSTYGPGWDDIIELGDGTVLPNEARCRAWLAATPSLPVDVPLLPVAGAHGQQATRARKGRGRPA
jgi:hypothetical protein